MTKLPEALKKKPPTENLPLRLLAVLETVLVQGSISLPGYGNLYYYTPDSPIVSTDLAETPVNQKLHFLHCSAPLFLRYFPYSDPFNGLNTAKTVLDMEGFQVDLNTLLHYLDGLSETDFESILTGYSHAHPFAC